MYITEEDVDEMVAVLMMAGEYITVHKEQLREFVREKLMDDRVPCFESRRWVKREKNDENK